ncbi:Aldehyde dehydrogenase family [Popillia japonica]|uniref:Aldehyde dehydrogenase family n=1 Tax=Popillia japonica TaxID=7064 RepID=A0AAW1IVY7_POPJA
MGLLKDKVLINGEWVSAATKATFNVKNPRNGSIVGAAPHMDASDAAVAIEAANEAFKTWQNVTADQRSALLRKCVADCAEEAKRIKGEIVSSPHPGKKCLIERQPIGVVGLITPWNFPLLLTARKIATALAAGCTCVVKPSEDTPLSTLSVIQLAEDAGVPKGVINVVTCDRANAAQIGKALCESRLIAGISFTGSTVVGKILYQQCASRIKRLCLELGGNAPFLVFNSANIDKAVETARVCGIVEEAKSRGANIVTGGQPAKEAGKLFYQPTLITNVTKDMQVYKDEIFGPVVSVTKFKTEEEGVAMAVDTEKGLASYFFSQDVAQIFRVSRLLQSGTVAVNDGMGGSPLAPFGGIKESGIGKEGSQYGIDECCYIKSITIGDL